jgi:hypothetical protein
VTSTMMAASPLMSSCALSSRSLPPCTRYQSPLHFSPSPSPFYLALFTKKFAAAPTILNIPLPIPSPSVRSCVHESLFSFGTSLLLGIISSLLHLFLSSFPYKRAASNLFLRLMLLAGLPSLFSSPLSCSSPFLSFPTLLCDISFFTC